MTVLVFVNAFFVAAEMGLARIRRTRVDQLVEEGNKTAELVQKELENPERFVSACQLGITLATLALGATGEEAFAVQASAAVKSWGVLPQASMPIAQALCYVGAFTLTAFFQTVFGELVPKVFTLERAEQVLFNLVWPMRLWCKITAPFLFVLNGFTSFIFRLFNIQAPPRRHYVHSGEELRMLVSASHEEGVIEEEAEEMLHSVFDFSETVASDVMTPRTDMICLAAGASVNEFVDMALKHGHSRLPVFEGDIDTIFGMVHIRDSLRAVIEHKGNTQVRELVRKVLIVPENKDAGDLLTEFKKTKTHMAIVVDEYGGTRGMVTMEDLIEELVGDIADEHEVVEEYILRQPDGAYLIDARVALDEVNEKLSLDITDEQFNTLGGHVFGMLGREPKVGDEVGNDIFTLRVEEADRHRILKLRLQMKEPQAEPQPSDSDGKTVVAPEGQSHGGKAIESTK
ncbi:MAG TPA: hemolysin family protein [Candidatus Obscuribacterales bacterium]